MKTYLKAQLDLALSKLEGIETLPDYTIEQPKVAEHGDAATNAAMLLTKVLKRPPRVIAQEIIDKMNLDSRYITSAEIAGPGFINFRFSPDWLTHQVDALLNAGSNFGKTSIYNGKKVIVEFVSANPTGPLTVGHGRNAVLGDTIARLYEWNGAEVTREYYFNNAGRQMRVLGESVKVRYQQLLGEHIELPEGHYEGDYIKDIASAIRATAGDGEADKEGNLIFKETAEKLIFEDIQSTLVRMNIHMDTYFNEDDLYNNGAINQVVARLREKDLAYDADGAVWFKTTQFGKEKDTVLVKSTGEPTYRLPDIAYHADKLDRGFDLCIDIFGADHIATYPDVLSGLTALGYDASKVDVLVYQFVTLVKDGKPYKMSTRKANFVTLDELMDEVGADVTRFFFLMRSPSTHLEFDIGQAKEAGEKNPVFYLQYAHARIHSILRKVAEEYRFEGDVDYTLLSTEEETNLIKTLLNLPQAVEQSALTKEPHRLITYLDTVATAFTQFYHHCRIMGVDIKLAQARTALAKATVQVLQNGLTILGITAPERM